jgi:alpha-1,2-glucosyltransferase
MLYLWPYIVFFSVPLVLRPVLSPIVDRLPNRLGSLCKMHLTGEQGTSYPRFLSYTVFVLCGTAVVYFNTIVHPYTLADNRHYVFYAFRILLRHPAIRYLAVPIYAACYFLAIRTLDSPNADSALVKQDRKDNQPGKGNIQQQPCKISLVIVLLITTTLSVATAPLVEPRYFIIPWIMWRLHVPCISASPTRNQQEASPYDVRLILETVWLLAINAAVGYSFLYWGFTWPSEPGNVQRFLW